MLIPYFLGNLGMGGGGTVVVYVTSDPFAAYTTTCVASASGDCSCSNGS